MSRTGLSNLLVVHGFVTLLAGIVLSLSPGLIPATVGVHLNRSAFLVAYLLAGAEVGLAVLSFGGSRLTDPAALRVIAWSCLAFHAWSALLELYAYSRGVNAVILANVAVRVVIIALFANFSTAPEIAEPRSAR